MNKGIIAGIAVVLVASIATVWTAIYHQHEDAEVADLRNWREYQEELNMNKLGDVRHR